MIAETAFASAPEPPPPPPPQNIFESRISLMPKAAANLSGDERSLEYEANPSISRGSTPASSQARRIASKHILNSPSGAAARL